MFLFQQETNPRGEFAVLDMREPRKRSDCVDMPGEEGSSVERHAPHLPMQQLEALPAPHRRLLGGVGEQRGFAHPAPELEVDGQDERGPREGDRIRVRLEEEGQLRVVLDGQQCVYSVQEGVERRVQELQ